MRSSASTYIGVTFRTRSLDKIREINRLVRADLWPTVEAGKLSLPIYETYPLDDIAEALALMRSNQHFRQDRDFHRMR